MMIVIDDAAGMTKYMWEYLDTVVIGGEMDIVDDLRKDPYEEERQYKREARLELGGILDKAADEIVWLREVLGMWLRYSKSDYDDHAQMIIDWSEAEAATKAALKEKE
jgi:hypothetical protein